MKYKFEIFEIHEEGKLLRVAEGESNSKEEAEKEMNHYAFQYAQDYPIKIKKNWKEDINSQSITEIKSKT